MIAILAMLTLATVAAANHPAQLQAPEDCDLIAGQPLVNKQWENSTLVYREQLCAAVGTGIVTYTEWSDGVTPASRTATVDEIAIWDNHVAEAIVGAELEAAEISLAADVDTGQKWVPKLREWQADAQNTYDQWPGMSDAAKDNATREMVRRLGLTWGGLADLLTVLDTGR